MEKEEIGKSVLNNLQFEPTPDQTIAISHISLFHVSDKNNPVYILKGYAGTGKTSLIGSYVKSLYEFGKRFVLLAPTGRAAKVLSQYTGMRATTIHRFIYLLTSGKDGVPQLKRAPNLLTDAVFIVDEASMIGDNRQQGDSLFGQRNLLEDLIGFVFSRENNRLLLVGDTAQLPPVGLEISPALDIQYLSASFQVTAYSFEMKTVMRQAFDSGILSSATILREKITSLENIVPLFTKKVFKYDIRIITGGNEFEELLQTTFRDGNIQEGIIICRTNKRANLFNKQVREKILQRETETEGGDLLMVVKNNYYWLDKQSEVGFIANGDLIMIRRLIKTEEMYGMKFADAEIQLIDYPGEHIKQVKILLDTLWTEGPGLSERDENVLFQRIEEDYQHIPERRKRMKEIKKNPWLNALRVKFGYAMTCHKTQGGQWPIVIIDQGFLTDEMINIEFLRWLYTALTRSTEKVFLVNFKDEFFC